MKNRLFVTELFTSLQGESSLVGLPTTFIRLSGCNLRCSWCDSQYTFPKGTAYTIDELIEKVKEAKTNYVCVTGGEPLLQDGVYELMRKLAEAGYTVSCETNGSLPIGNIDSRVRIILDIKCPGSGQAEKNMMGNLEILRPHDEVKFVIANEADYKFAKGVVQKFKLANVLLSPAWGLLEAQTLADWIVQDRIPARLNLQLHKMLWGQKPGV